MKKIKKSVSFSKKCINSLYKLLNKKYEISGSFSYIKKNDNRYILNCVQQNNNTDYKDDSVEAVYSEFTFHTHPHFVYNKYNTNIGWPSVQDYLVLLDFEKMKGHFVISVEGIWIIFLLMNILDKKIK